MYHGNNPIALRSREWLRQAMLTLLKKKNYSDITVKELCAQADLSRQTFYQIFTSKEEILAYHFSVLFGHFTATLPQEVQHSRLLFDCFFEFFYANKDFITILTVNKLTYLLENQIEQYLQKIELFRHTAQNAGHADYLTAYIAGALTQTLLHWAAQGYDLSPAQLSRFIWELGKGEYTRS